MRAATVSGVSTSALPRSSVPEHDFLSVEGLENRAVEVGLGGFEGDLLAMAAASSGRKE
jgi:hypothetical protein